MNDHKPLDPTKMYIHIKPNALDIYKQEINYDLRSRQGLKFHKNEISWLETIYQVQGLVLEVDTQYLFNDQYNTTPIEDISTNGLRIMDSLVQEVIYDKRQGFGRCSYCAKISLAPKCSKGCDPEHFTVF